MGSYLAKYTPEQRKNVLKYRNKKIKERWDSYTPEEREAQVQKTAGVAQKAHQVSCAKRRAALVEEEVVRINDYSGTITESELRELQDV